MCRSEEIFLRSVSPLTFSPFFSSVGGVIISFLPGNLYTISMGISIAANFFLGIFYDRFGARVCAWLGALGCGVGFVMIWACLQLYDYYFR